MTKIKEPTNTRRATNCAGAAFGEFLSEKYAVTSLDEIKSMQEDTFVIKVEEFFRSLRLVFVSTFLISDEGDIVATFG